MVDPSWSNQSKPSHWSVCVGYHLMWDETIDHSIKIEMGKPY